MSRVNITTKKIYNIKNNILKENIDFERSEYEPAFLGSRPGNLRQTYSYITHIFMISYDNIFLYKNINIFI